MKLRTPEPRTLITSGSQDEGGSSYQDCSLVHLKPGRMKDGSMWSRKTQGPPGKQTWTWWLQPQTWRSGREGMTVPCTGLPCPGVWCQVARAAPPAPPSGVLLGLGFRPRPSRDSGPAPPSPGGRGSARGAVREAAPPPGGRTGWLPAIRRRPRSPDSRTRLAPQAPAAALQVRSARSPHNPDRGDQEKQEQERPSPLDIV